MDPSGPNEGDRVTVVGAARAGRAAARMLRAEGARVFVTEQARRADPELEREFEQRGIAYEFGGHSERAVEADWAICSPGVPQAAEIVGRLEEAGVPILGELEAAWRRWEGPVVAVTGTNGKTTTVRMIGAIYEAAGRPHVVAGNVGVPLSRCVERGPRSATAIVEVSSFQLDRIVRFQPEVAVLLNISADHLDRYENDLDRYARSKARIFENQSREDVLVYDRDDSLVRRQVEAVPEKGGPRRWPLSGVEEHRPGAFLPPGVAGRSSDASTPAGPARIHLSPEETFTVDMRELTIFGPHNRRNALAASAAAAAAGIEERSIGPALQDFEGMPHRLELVREIDGVRYVNDSKATNVEAVRSALESFPAPIVLIAGGRDKGNDYGGVADLVDEKVALVLALGESREKIVREVAGHAVSVERMESLEQAVHRAAERAPAGATVLLSPACSSFDMFEDYRHRGRVFKRAVRTL